MSKIQIRNKVPSEDPPKARRGRIVVANKKIINLLMQ